MPATLAPAPLTPEMQARIAAARENLRDQPALTPDEIRAVLSLFGKRRR